MPYSIFCRRIIHSVGLLPNSIWNIYLFELNCIPINLSIIISDICILEKYAYWKTMHFGKQCKVLIKIILLYIEEVLNKAVLVDNHLKKNSRSVERKQVPKTCSGPGLIGFISIHAQWDLNRSQQIVRPIGFFSGPS